MIPVLGRTVPHPPIRVVWNSLDGRRGLVAGIRHSGLWDAGESHVVDLDGVRILGLATNDPVMILVMVSSFTR